MSDFIKGTAILICANAISKILGAVFKIPLTYLLHEEGMAIYNTAFSVYIMLLSFVTSGMPLAVSKMISEESALGNENSIRKIMTVSTLLLSVLGLVGSCTLWFGAEFFAISAKEAKAFFCLKAIAPSVFFVALGTAYKSYYQGKSNMTPTAVSQVTEAFVKLSAGFVFAYLFSEFASEYTAAAAISGVTAGEIIATFILFILYLPHRFRMPNGKSEKSVSDILKPIFSVALPTVLASAVSGAMNLIDVTIIRRCVESIKFTPDGAEHFLRQYSSYTTVFDNLSSTLRISSDGSRWLYGAYSGYALTVFHLPVGILASLGISILPVISGSIAKKNFRKANICVGIAAKLTMFVCMPASFCIALFSEPILKLLFGTSSASLMLACLSPCLIFISLSQIYCTVLNASGSICQPLIFGFIGECVKLGCNFIFIKNQYINILGTVISANIAYFVTMMLSFLSVRQKFTSCSDIAEIFVKPFFSSLFTAAIMYMLYNPFTVIFSSDKIALILSLSVGGAAYILMSVHLKYITREDMAKIKMSSDTE